MNRTRVDIAKPQIQDYFSKLSSNVLAYEEINHIFSQQRETWKLAKGMSTTGFVEFLLDQGILKAIKVKFPHKSVVRYIAVNDIGIYELTATLLSRGYFSHGSAIYLHGLTTQGSKIIYINEEQRNGNSNNDNLIQERIDAAFKRPPRISNNKAKVGEYTVCMLNGMNTGMLGIETFEIDGVEMDITNIERTLIDAAVRPLYSGGVHGVLEAYKLAKNKVSVQSLAKMYRQIGYSYPYHQAIGFYLEASGEYSSVAIREFHKMRKKFDFYLIHQMEEISYSQKWRLYYPTYLDKYLPNSTKS